MFKGVGTFTWTCTLYKGNHMPTWGWILIILLSICVIIFLLRIARDYFLNKELEKLPDYPFTE